MRDHFRRFKLLYCVMCYGCVLSQASTMPSAVESNATLHSPSTLLGWVYEKNSLCRGSFSTPVFKASQGAMGSYHLNADQIHLKGSTIQAQGQIRVDWPLKALRADRLCIWKPKDQEKQLRLSGRVQFDWPQGRVVAQQASMSETARSGQWLDAWYRLSLTQAPHSLWGHAQSVTLKDHDWHIHQASYAICSPLNRYWHLETKDLWIDEAQGLARLKSARLKIGDIPVFVWPYLSFPIKGQRATGWLMPHIKHTNHSGSRLVWPWYWNIAPHQDLTLTPEWGLDSGGALGAYWRHLTVGTESHFKGFFIFNDRVFESFRHRASEAFNSQPYRKVGVDALKRDQPQRWGFDLSHVYHQPAYTLDLKWAQLSDDELLRDFPQVIETEDQAYLLRALEWRWASQWLQMHGVIHDWQVIHSVLSSLIPNAYAAQPQWSGQGIYPLGDSSQVHLFWDVARFNWRALPNMGSMPTGDRLVFDPAVQWQQSLWSGLLTTTLGLHHVAYHLNHSDHHSVHHTIPSISAVWEGMYPVSLHSGVTAKLFYGWVPFKDQQDVPRFDTVSRTQFYPELFEVDRFTGHDLKADTHHIALGVTWTHFDRNTHEQRSSIALGQAWSLARQRVCLSSTCEGVDWHVRSPSPLQLMGHWSLNDSFKVDAWMAWHWALNHFIDTNILATWSNDRGTQLGLKGLSMHWERDNGFDQSIWPQSMKQHAFEASVQQTLNTHWNVYASGQWDFHAHHLLSLNTGLKWEECCISLKLGVTRRYNGLQSTGQRQFFNGVYVQLGLTGLGH